MEPQISSQPCARDKLGESEQTDVDAEARGELTASEVGVVEGPNLSSAPPVNIPYRHVRKSDQ